MSKDRTTEMLNYLSAISREVGEMRAEINARFEGINVRLEKVETGIKEIKYELRLMRDDFRVAA